MAKLARLVVSLLFTIMSACPFTQLLISGSQHRAACSRRKPTSAAKTIGTFSWHVPSDTDKFLGRVYTDGSVGHRWTGATAAGWAFVVTDEYGHVKASAHGLTPPWIHTSIGAEVWAFYVAVLLASPGCKYRIDCAACVDTFHRGRAYARTLPRPMNRLWDLLFDAFPDNAANSNVAWMPGHTTRLDIGKP